MSSFFIAGRDTFSCSYPSPILIDAKQEGTKEFLSPAAMSCVRSEILLLLLLDLLPVLSFRSLYIPCVIIFSTLHFKTPPAIQGRGTAAHSGGFVSLVLPKTNTNKATFLNRVNKHSSSRVRVCLKHSFER